MKFKFLALCLLPLAVSACDGLLDLEYVITWKNYDNTVLLKETYKSGEMPTYKGETPTREASAQYTYSFSGWSPEVKLVTKDMSYVAQFNETINTYTVTWKNDDGTVLDTETYSYGEMPSYKDNDPTKIDENNIYYYTFDGWDKEIESVTSDATYTATFTRGEIFDFQENPTGFSLKKLNYLVSENLTIPLKYNEKPITTIEDRAFYNCESLVSIAIPNTVVFIGQEAFSGCSSLSSIEIPNSVLNIGNEAFSGCSSLTSVTIPDKLTTIGFQLFYDCISLISIDIPENVNSINTSAFINCLSLTSINVDPNNQKYASVDGVLYNKDKTQILYFPERYIGSYTIPASLGDDIFPTFYTASIKSPSLTYIDVDPNNPNYTSINGVVFSKDQTQLVLFPSGYSGSYEIPSGVTSIGLSAFSNCLSLTSVIIPSTVTSIGNRAFENCSSLESVTISNGVTSIGDGAFYNCSSLTSITIPESVTSYSSTALEGCVSLTKITFLCDVYKLCLPYGGCASLEEVNIGSLVSSLNSYPFDNCPFLASINVDPDNQYYSSVDGVLYNKEKTELLAIPERYTGTFVIPESVTYFTWNTIYECQYITQLVASPNSQKYSTENGILYNKEKTSLLVCPPGYVGPCDIPDSVTYIRNSAFYNCSSLTSVTIPNGVTSIDGRTFQNCSSLLEFRIPESVTIIDSSSFQNCSSLTSIEIPDTVKSIKSSAFSGCSSLTKVMIGKGVTSINETAFDDCDSLIDIEVSVLNDTYYSVDGVLFKKDGNKLFIFPKGFVGHYRVPNDVSTIENSVFSNCHSLTSVAISDSVTSMGNSTFSGCDSLKTVKMGNGITLIPTYAFSGCNSLTSITISNTLTRIDDYVFYNCSSLYSITLPESLTSIGNNAFYNCSSLTSITIPDSVTSIDYTAFAQCTSLEKIEIGSGLTSIGPSLFSNCESLASIAISDGVTKIEDSAFYNCYSLESITIPESVASIGDYAFRNCSCLTSITIPNSVTSIGSYAFEGCRFLSSITIPNSVTTISYSAFAGDLFLSSVVIPDSVTTIGYRVFDRCPYLKNIFYEGDYESFSQFEDRIDISLVYYYSETEPTDPGNYWHYVDGVPTVW